MSRLRLWHGMIVIAVSAWVFTLARFDDDPLHLALVLLINSLSVYLAIRGARQTGRRWYTGVALGIVLGPIGAFLAWRDRVPESMGMTYDPPCKSVFAEAGATDGPHGGPYGG